MRARDSGPGCDHLEAGTPGGGIEGKTLQAGTSAGGGTRPCLTLGHTETLPPGGVEQDKPRQEETHMQSDS